MTQPGCCVAPDCCGPGSYCCGHAGPHTHEDHAAKPTPSTDPPWCWADLDGTTTCLMVRGHSGNHAGTPLEGGWVRWGT